MRSYEITENISTLAKGAATALKSVAGAKSWSALPKHAQELESMSPALRNEFLVRFPNRGAMEKALDDLYQAMVSSHRAGNRQASQSLQSAHDYLNMMLSAGPSDQLMTAFKAALKSQTL